MFRISLKLYSLIEDKVLNRFYKMLITSLASLINEFGNIIEVIYSNKYLGFLIIIIEVINKIRL
jgi:hypothetical protein